MSDDTEFNCDIHGEAYATYVCEHLAKDPAQRWYSSPPSAENRWPDAWCSACHEEFLKEGEWNESNEHQIVPNILCHQCYESAQARSLDCLQGEAKEAWDELIAESIAAARRKQDLLEEEFQIGKHQRWDWDQEKAQLVFSNDGVAALLCDIAFIGSVSTISNTWLWSWANFNLTDSVRTPMDKVREFGEARDLPKLIVPKWPAEEVDGWEMSAVAIEVINARGIYRTPTQNGFLFLAILNVNRPQ